MQVEPGQNQDLPTPRCYRGPRGLGETVARVLGEREETGAGGGGLEDGTFLEGWFRENGGFIAEEDWDALEPFSNSTAEHEVRFRITDRRAVKRTWPGTFGNVPRETAGRWIPGPATAAEYLHRLALQNELFGDDLRLEGALIPRGPSMIIGQRAGGISLVSSQPWLKAADDDDPYPNELEIVGLLRTYGFEPMLGSLYGWRHLDEGIIVLDAKPDNFIKTNAGILPIDLLLTQIFPLN